MASKKIGKNNGKKRSTRKKRLRVGRVFLALTVLGIGLYLFFHFVSFPIKNIYIEGNSVFSDQEIIEMAKLSNYPSIFRYTSFHLEKVLEKNTYIKKATVKKKNLKEVYIQIEENRALFYNQGKDVTVLSDKTEVRGELDAAVLINYVPDTLYDKFVEKILTIQPTLYSKVSEIKYDPNKVDDKRFLLTINDGNYVYLTLNHFEKFNNYVEIMQQVLSKYKEDKGILYLDEGEYFKKID